MVVRVYVALNLLILLFNSTEKAVAQTYPSHVGNIIDVGGQNPSVTGSIFYEPYHIFKSGNYAYVACSNSSTLAIFDVSNPAAPLPVGNLKDGVGGAVLAGASSVYVSGNYAYVTSESSSTLEIVDVTNPAAPVHKGKIVDSGSPTSPPYLHLASNVFVAGNYAYVIASSILEIVDVSNPASPTHVGNLGGIGNFNYGGYQVFVVGNYAYAQGPSGNFVVIDVSVPTTPVIVANLSSVPTTEVYVSGNYAYVTSYTSAPVSSFNIIDITTPTAPVVVGAGLSQSGALWYAPYYSAGHVYFGTNNSIQVVDVTTPATPTIVGSIADGTNGATLNSVYSVVVSGNYAYSVANSSSSLDILDISNPTAPTKVYSFIDDMGSGPLLYQPNAVAVAGNYAYVGSSGSEALEIVDISNPAAPVHKGSLTDGQNSALLMYASSIVVSGNYAYCAVSGAKGGGYVAGYENGLEIVDVSNPAAPVHKGSIVDSGTPGIPPYLNNAQSVFVVGNLAYVASYGSNALEIVDITNPAAPVHKGSIVDGGGTPPLLNHPQAVFVSGNYAYVASKGSGSLEVIDVTNPANPTRVGGVTVTSPNAIYVSGSLVYVVGGGSTLDIIDVSNPSSPVLKGSLADGVGGALLNNGGSIVVSGNYAYVTSNVENSVEVVDVSNPAAPVHYSNLTDGTGGALLNYPQSIVISGNYAYVASYHSNALEILSAVPAATINISSQPNTAYAVCVGATQNISTSGTGTTNIAYQWQFSSDGIVPFTDLTNSGGYSNVTTSSIAINSTGNFGAGVYRCKVSGDYAPLVYTTNSTLTVNAVPASPVAPGINNCGPGSVIITASGGSNGNYIWYDQTNTVITGQANSTYTTPSLSSSTNFSVAITNGNCVSPATSTTVTINPLPASPISANTSNCGSGSVILSASGGSNGNYIWYDPTNAVISGQINSTYTTPVISATSNYSVAITNGTCTSTPTTVTVTINLLPVTPTTQGASSCPGVFNLTASGGTNGQYVWYSVASGGTPISGAVNGTYTTPAITVTTTYYVSINNGTCEGARASVIATINCPAPVITTSPLTTQVGGVVTLNLVPLITTPNNSLDITSLQIAIQPSSGAKASISSTGVLTLDYTGVTFAGTDLISIKACDTYGDCTTQQFSIDVFGDIVIYNGISPNGKNPSFIIEYISLLPSTKSNTVYIFDRWENMVWHGTNYDNTSVVFTGVSDSGNDLPTGVYFYKIDFGSGRKTQTGFISLRRQ
jgi:hypothetical protein